ncbi:BQ5605_C020g09158 [Microbotryum silenes-dioicae]|uniref:BQ5605_C020g09158 protein n=1 Tax=Microbotryum silenes-dioicae TaxID=796604 RepID=A0A2X0MME0_9BASI|nr:BQ5605_C020g09158 [Microbotryum silenes-dioicae]
MPVPIRFSRDYVSMSTLDSSPNPQLISMNPAQKLPVGSRYESVPHVGPGTAVYVRQPTRSQLVSLLSCWCPWKRGSLYSGAAPREQKANSGLFSNPNRAFYIPDPEGKPFVDVDGVESGPRWILIDPQGKVGSDDGKKHKEERGCCIM